MSKTDEIMKLADAYGIATAMNYVSADASAKFKALREAVEQLERHKDEWKDLATELHTAGVNTVERALLAEDNYQGAVLDVRRLEVELHDLRNTTLPALQEALKAQHDEIERLKNALIHLGYTHIADGTTSFANDSK